MIIGKIRGCEVCGHSTQNERFCDHHKEQLNRCFKKQKEKKVEFVDLLLKELSKPRKV